MRESAVEPIKRLIVKVLLQYLCCSTLNRENGYIFDNFTVFIGKRFEAMVGLVIWIHSGQKNPLDIILELNIEDEEDRESKIFPSKKED